MTNSASTPTKHIMMCQYTERWPSIERRMVALFDERDFSEDEVLRLVNSHQAENNENIVIITQHQFNTVFRSLLQKGEESKHNG